MNALQSRLTTAVNRAISLIEAGDSPLDSLVKVATADSLLPDQVDRLCQLWNRSSLLTQRLTTDSLGDKLAAAEIVQPKDVMARVFAREVKSSAFPMRVTAAVLEVSRANMFKAEQSKLAEAPKAIEPPPTPVRSKLAGMFDGLRDVEFVEKREELRKKEAALVQAGEDALRYGVVQAELAERAVRKLAGYPDGSERVAQFQFWVSRMLPQASQMVETWIAPLGTERFRAKVAEFAATVPTRWLPEVVGPNSAATQLQLAVEAAGTLQSELPKLAGQLARVREEQHTLQSGADGWVVSDSVFVAGDTSWADHQRDHLDKVASFVETYAASMLAGGANKPSNPRALTGPEKYLLKLQHPQHETQLGSVRSRRALQEMLVDDQVLRSHPPAEVVAAFNEVSAYSPKVTENPATLRAVLRQYLQNNSSSFDLAQLRNLERSQSSPKGISG